MHSGGTNDLVGMRRAGRLASVCLAELAAAVRPGMTTQAIDDLQMAFARRHGVRPAQLGYKGFPKSVCTSVNEVICHGIPSPRRVLRDGDIVKIDVTLEVDGYLGDTCAAVPVGAVAPERARLMGATLEALRRGIAAVRPGAHVGDIGHAIQSFVEPLGYSVVRQFVGHGIGRRFHEGLQVPHFGRPGEGPVLEPGMTFTIEPMINEGSWRAVILDDGWTAVTIDGKCSAQYEHTIIVTDEGAEILTVQNAAGAWEPPGGIEPP